MKRRSILDPTTGHIISTFNPESAQTWRANSKDALHLPQSRHMWVLEQGGVCHWATPAVVQSWLDAHGIEGVDVSVTSRPARRGKVGHPRRGAAFSVRSFRAAEAAKRAREEGFASRSAWVAHLIDRALDRPSATRL